MLLLSVCPWHPYVQFGVDHSCRKANNTEYSAFRLHRQRQVVWPLFAPQAWYWAASSIAKFCFKEEADVEHNEGDWIKNFRPVKRTLNVRRLSFHLTHHRLGTIHLHDLCVRPEEENKHFCPGGNKEKQKTHCPEFCCAKGFVKIRTSTRFSPGSFDWKLKG